MFGINKNGTKHKVGIIMPAFFPASRTTYDNTTSGLSATRVQGAIDVLNAMFGTGSGRANCMAYREEITSITADMWASIADGTFSKVHVGMHYTAPSGRTYFFADADYFFGYGYTEQASHHMLVIEDEINHTAQHQTTNETIGGAASSLIYTTTLPGIQSELETDFGSAHIKTQSIVLSNAAGSAGPSSYGFVDKDAQIMNARMVFGNPICNIGNTSEVYNGGNRFRQVSLFRAMPETLIARDAGNNARTDWWLDDVESASAFGIVRAQGFADRPGASQVAGVRRAFLIG